MGNKGFIIFPYLMAFIIPRSSSIPICDCGTLVLKHGNQGE